MQEKNQLEPGVQGLKQEKQREAEAVKQLKQEWARVQQSLVADNQRRNQLKDEMESLEATSQRFDTAIADRAENLYVSHLILDFLFAPKAISDRDLDHLVSMPGSSQLGMLSRRSATSTQSIPNPMISGIDMRLP